MKFLIWLSLLLSLVSCSSVKEATAFEMQLGKDGYPNGVLKEVPFEIESIDLGLNECDGKGVVSEGNVFLSDNYSNCFVILVNQNELNSVWGINLDYFRPVLDLYLLEGKRTIFVDGRYSRQMQEFLLREYYNSHEFYEKLPGYTQDLLKEAPYWEREILLKEISSDEVHELDTAVTGALYGQVFGEKPKYHGDAYHRGRYVEILKVHYSCTYLKRCVYEEHFEYFLEFKQ